MLLISPTTEIELRHSASCLAVAESGHIAAADSAGTGSFLEPDHVSCTPFKAPCRVSSLALSPDGAVLAIAGDGELALISPLSGEIIYRVEAPIESCYFSPSGELWTSACPRVRRGYTRTYGGMSHQDLSEFMTTLRAPGTGLPEQPPSFNDGKLMIEVRMPKTWKVIARTEMIDPLDGGAFMFISHPDPNVAAIWGGAGQDGQCVMWARRNGRKIEVDIFRELDDVSPPSFNPDGDRFIAVCENELREYEFPKGPLVGRMSWGNEGIDEMRRMGDQALYVDSSRALLPIVEERLYLVDLEEMAVVDEISIRGHEPVPCRIQSSNDDGEPDVSSDLREVVLLPRGELLSLHADPSLRRSGKSRDSMLTWSLPPLEEGL